LQPACGHEKAPHSPVVNTDGYGALTVVQEAKRMTSAIICSQSEAAMSG
jgi:hypothetical protein